jgi:hypothetical protein
MRSASSISFVMIPVPFLFRATAAALRPQSALGAIRTDGLGLAMILGALM